MARLRQLHRAVQLTLDHARRPCGRGGWRPGAGRPRGRTTASHAKRPALSPRTPVHVTLRVRGGLASLRRERVAAIARAAIFAGHRDDFRVVHFNVLANHVHLLIEAASSHALARGMQGLNVRLARRINRCFRRIGALFSERYHARALSTPSEVRLALRYVLLNARHHAAERGERLAPGWLDPFSSALWFDGWREAPSTDAPWLQPLVRAPCPVAAARTWLLRVGWRKAGLIAVDDIPGRAR